MFKKTFIFLILSIFCLSVSATTSDPTHSECDSFQAEIHRLNQKDSALFQYSVFPIFKTDENSQKQIPICVFEKRTSGVIEFETQISILMSAADLEKRLNGLKSYFYELTEKDNNKFCKLAINTFYTLPGSTEDRLRLVVSSQAYCYSDNDLGYLESLHLGKVLDFVSNDKGFAFQIFGK